MTVLVVLSTFLTTGCQDEIQRTTSAGILATNEQRVLTMATERAIKQAGLDASFLGDKKLYLDVRNVGMADLGRQKARTLSGGEMQRVSLARAMVLQPDVLLLDEPTANLDPYNVGLIEEIICTLNRERKTTLVLVTHNVFQARRLAHRVGLILDGRLVEVDKVDRFFEQPQDARTTAFVRGEMVY